MRFPLLLPRVGVAFWLLHIWAVLLVPLVGAARPHARKDGGQVHELLVHADGSMEGLDHSRRSIHSLLEAEQDDSHFLPARPLQRRQPRKPVASSESVRSSAVNGPLGGAVPVQEIVLEVPEYLQHLLDGHHLGQNSSEGFPFPSAALLEEAVRYSPAGTSAMPQRPVHLRERMRNGWPLDANQEQHDPSSRWQESQESLPTDAAAGSSLSEHSMLEAWSNPWTPESVVTMLRQFEVENPRAHLEAEEEEQAQQEEDDEEQVEHEDADRVHSGSDVWQHLGDVTLEDQNRVHIGIQAGASSFNEVAAHSLRPGPLSEEDWGEFDEGSVPAPATPATTPAPKDQDSDEDPEPPQAQLQSRRQAHRRSVLNARKSSAANSNTTTTTNNNSTTTTNNNNNNNNNNNDNNEKNENVKMDDNNDDSSNDDVPLPDSERFTQAAWRAFQGETTTAMPTSTTKTIGDTRLPWEKVPIRSDCLGNASLDSDMRGRSFHYRLDSRGAAGINVASMFEGREFPNCSGKVYLDLVDVVAITNETDPVNGSHGLIYIPEAKESYTVYICYKAVGTEFVLGQRCLTEIKVNPRPWTILSMLDNYYTQWWFPSMAKKLTSLYRVNFWILSAFETFVASLLAIWLIVMTYVIFKLASARNVPEKKKPRPLKIPSAEESFAKNAMQMVTFCVALINLAGISIREMTLFANTNLIHSILFLGCTTSTVGIWRLTHHMYVDQLYDTGLVNGRFLTFGNSWHVMDMLLVFACASMICLIIYGLLLVSTQTMNLSPLADCLSALLGLGKVFQSTWAKISDRQAGVCRISVFDLENSLKGQMRESDAADWEAWNESSHDKEEESAAAAAAAAGGSFFGSGIRSSPREDLLQIMRENDDVKLPWKAFCGACRNGEDPLSRDAGIERLKQEFEDCSGFGLLDLLWHPNYFYRRRGSRVAFGNLPAALSFILGMVLFFVLQTLLFEVSIPELERLVSSKGEFHPNFDHERREFNLFHHKAFDTLSLLTAHMRETTRVTNLSTSMVALGSLSNHSSDVTNIPLTVHKQYPVDLHLHQQGVADRVSDYNIDIVPVRQALVSMVIEDQSGWTQCIKGPEVIYKEISVPPWSSNLTIEMFILDYTMMVPGTREDVERARSWGLATVITVYEPFRPVPDYVDEYWTCGYMCKDDPHKECIAYTAGPHGCYLGIMPVVGTDCMQLHEQGRTSAFKRSRKFLDFKTSAADSVSLCPAGYDEKDCTYSSTMSADNYGYIDLLMPEIMWPSSRWSEYIMEWYMQSSQGQEITYQTNHLWFVRGISLPENVQVILPEGINTYTPGKPAENWITYNFIPYPMNIVPLSFRALIVPLMTHSDFALSPQEGQEVVTELPDDGWTVWNLTACDEPGAFADSLFCGGSVKMPAVLVEIHKWEPQLAEVELQIAPVDKEKYSHLAPESLTVTFGTLNGEHPAGWAVKQTCELDLKEVPEQLFQTYLTFDAFEHGVQLCTDIKVLYTNNDGRVMLTLPMILWFQMGLLMHADEGSRIKLLKAALKSNSLPNLGSIVFPVDQFLYHPISELPGVVAVFAPSLLHVESFRPIPFYWSSLLQDDSQVQDRALVSLMCLTGKGILSHRTLAPAVRMASEQRLMELVDCIDFVRPPSVTLSATTSVPVAAIQWGKIELLKKLLLKDGVRNWVVNAEYWRDGHPERVGKRTLLDYVVTYGCQKCVKLIKKAIEVLNPILKAVGQGKDISQLLGGSVSPLTTMVRGFIQHLRRGHSLARLRLSQSRLREVSLEPFLDTLVMLQTEIRHIELAHNGFNHFALADIGRRLKEMAELRSLDISENGGVTNCKDQCLKMDTEGFQQAFSWLPGLKKVKTLRIGCLGLCSVGGVAVADYLKQMPQLEVLDISNNHIGPLAAKALADALAVMPNLTTLDVSGNNLGEKGLELLNLDRLPGLKRLRAGTNVLADQLDLDGFSKQLATLTQLEEFVFDHNFVSNRRFPALAQAIGNLKDLQVLRLHQVGVNGNVGELLRDMLGKLPNLVELRLGGNALDGRGLEALHILKAPLLAELGMEDWNIVAAGPEEMSRWLSHILPTFPKLKVLHLEGNGLIGTDIWSLSGSLRSLVQLKELSIGRNFVNCNGVAALGEALNGLNNLTHLSIADTCLDSSFFENLQHLPKLQHLDLKNTYWHHEGIQGPVERFFTRWGRLRSLDISFVSTRAHSMPHLVLRTIRSYPLLNTLAMTNMTPAYDKPNFKNFRDAVVPRPFPSLVLLQVGISEEDLAAAQLALPGVRIA